MHALLVVDTQRGFLNDYTSHIPSRIATLIAQNDYEPVLFTRFVNEEGGPYHRFLGWHACKYPPDTDLAPDIAAFAQDDAIFTKPGLAGMSDELKAYLIENEIEAVTLVGIDTDMCVLKIALDIFDLGIEPFVLVDCCASTLGLQAHLAGLAVLARNIGATRLRDAGLSGGQMGAPQ